MRLKFLYLLLLASCAQINQDPKSSVSLPEKFVSDSESVKKSPVESSAQNYEWWKNFNSKTLNQLIGEANKQNLDIKIAKARLQKASAQKEFAISSLFPTTYFSADGKRQNQGFYGSESIKAFTSYGGAVNGEWNIDLFGASSSVAITKSNLKAAEYSKQEVIKNLAAELTSGLAEYQFLKESLKLAEANTALQQNIHDLFKKRFEAGLSSRLELNDALERLESSKLAVTNLNKLLKSREYSIELLLDKNSGSMQDPLNNAEQLEIMEDIILGAPAEVIFNRPDVKIAEENFYAATHSLNAAKSDRYPSLKLTSLLGVTDRSISELFSAPFKKWSYGAEVLLPFIDFGRISAKIDVATAEQKEALLVYKKTVQTALSEVNTNIEAYKEAEKNRLIQQNFLNSASASMDLMQKKYNSGIISKLELMQEQTNYNSAKNAFNEAELALIKSIANFYKSTGSVIGEKNKDNNNG